MERQVIGGSTSTTIICASSLETIRPIVAMDD
jgi:hypothetical protein